MQDGRGTVRRAAVPLLIFMLAAAVWGQQTFVTRFDQFDGYTYLNSPKVSLAESGFHTQFGVRVRKWVSLGFDYSVSKGNLTLTPDLLVPATQQLLTAQLTQLALAGVIPPTYKLVVPASSVTQTFAAGPQVAFRHWNKITVFVRPSCGLIHENATPHASDPIAAGVVAELAPSGHKTDTTAFWGAGGGVDFILGNRISIRLQGDFVHDHLFSDLLQASRNTVRISIGPCFNFGGNILK